ncbi:MAG: hypothetical protein CMH58_06200 [Myxococcales bacterium]|nr:hypothetical protein [Myxococcales bacterium]
MAGAHDERSLSLRDLQPSTLDVYKPVRNSVFFLSLFYCLLYAGTKEAEACGQQTHTWISLKALELLPESPLRRLLSDPAQHEMLVNGSMFPDGGYAIDHPYGEAAHWAPFHRAYLRWIQEQFDAPYDDPVAATHVAFLMGLTSHGLADEYYDATFFAASRVHDARSDDLDHHDNFDTQTDVLFAAASGHRLEPSATLPMEPILYIFDHVLDLEVEADQIQRGQELLQTAAWLVATGSQNPSEIATAHIAYPWAGEHIDDEGVSGSPPVIAEAVAAQWQALWAVLQGEQSFNDLPVSFSWPREGEALSHRQGGVPESRVAVILSAAIDRAAQLSEFGSVVRDGDAVVPHSSAFFYRDRSHVVVADPETEWPAAERLQFVLPEGLETYDGDVLDEPVSIPFRTVPVVPEPPVEHGCSCSHGKGGPWDAFAWMLLLLGINLRSGNRHHGRSG